MERCKPVIKHVGGDVDWVCPNCYEGLSYDLYMHKSEVKETA